MLKYAEIVLYFSAQNKPQAITFQKVPQNSITTS